MASPHIIIDVELELPSKNGEANIKTYPVHFDATMAAWWEREYGHSVGEMLATEASRVRFLASWDCVRCAIWAGLRYRNKTLTVDNISDMMPSNRLAYYVTKVREGATAMMQMDSPEAEAELKKVVDPLPEAPEKPA
jgi:hypothetical protein